MAKEIATKTKLDTRIAADIAAAMPVASKPVAAKAALASEVAKKAIVIDSEEVQATADQTVVDSSSADVIVAQAAGASSSAAAGGAAAGGMSTTALVVAGVAVAAAAGSSSSSSPAPAPTPASATPAAPVAGQNFSLKIGATTGEFDNITGTSGNDTITAGPGALEVGDRIDGGAGTDTLYVQDAASGVNADISNVEIIYVRNDMTAGDTFSLSNTTGLKEVWADRLTNTNNTLTIDGITTAVQIGVYKGGSATAADVEDVTFTFSGVTGTSDSANLVLDAAQLDVLTVAGVEVLNIKAQGGTNKIDGTLTAQSATKVVITGDKNLTIDATDIDAANSYSVDASAFTGNLNITLEDQSAGKTSTITGGAGNDSIYLAAGLDASDSVDGGTGTNTIGFTDASDLTAITGAKLKNFTILDATGMDDDIDLDFITGGGTSSTINRVVVAGNITAGKAINDLADGGDLLIKASEANGFIVSQKDASAAGSNNDTLKITLGDATSTGNVTAASITVANVETIEFSSTFVDGITTGHTVTATTFGAASTVKISGDEKVTFTSLGAVAASLIDASGMTDSLVITATTAATAVLIKGGSAADTITIDDGTQLAGTTVQGNGGADVIDLDNNAVAMVVKFAAVSDSSGTKWDKITNFDDAAEDTIDLAFLGATGTAVAALLDKSATVTSTTTGSSADFTISAANATNFFNDNGIKRLVAFDDNGTDTFLFVDADQDGNWDAGKDMAILLIANSNTLTTADITFA